MRAGILAAVMIAMCVPAHAQQMRPNDDPELSPDYDPKKPAVVTTTTTTTASYVSAPGGFPRTAFVFETRLALGGTLAAGGPTPGFVNANGDVVSSNLPGIIAQPSLWLGVRLIDRLQVGLGISFVRMGANDFSSNNILFEPSIAIDLIKSRDNRTAFYVKPAFGLGASVASAGGQHDTSAVVAIDIAIGVRHALGSMFALGFESGLSAAFTNPGESSGTDVVFIYGAIVGSFFYAGR